MTLGWVTMTTMTMVSIVDSLLDFSACCMTSHTSFLWHFSEHPTVGFSTPPTKATKRMQARQSATKKQQPTPPRQLTAEQGFQWEDFEGELHVADEQRRANLTKPYLNGEIEITQFADKDFVSNRLVHERKEQTVDGVTISLFWPDSRDVIFIDENGSGLFKIQVCSSLRSFVVTLPVMTYAKRHKNEYEKVFNTADEDAGKILCWCPFTQKAHKMLRTHLEKEKVTTKTIKYDFPADLVFSPEIFDQASQNGVVEPEYEIVQGAENQMLFLVHWQIATGDAVDVEIHKQKTDRAKVAKKLATKWAIQSKNAGMNDEDE
jgi:hypothetical protein